MAEDLATLMPRFVAKRRHGLRGAVPLTLKLLASSAVDFTEDALLEQYCDAQPPPASRTTDLLCFATFLIAEAEARAASIEHGRIIAEMARLERLRLRASCSESPLWPAKTQTRLLRLHPSVAWDSFSWDLRLLRRIEDLPTLVDDPCVLLCVQSAEDGRVSLVRIDKEATRAVEIIDQLPEALTASALCTMLGTGRHPEAVLGQLIAHGAVLGAVS
jgi:hypothetical protein